MRRILRLFLAIPVACWAASLAAGAGLKGLPYPVGVPDAEGVARQVYFVNHFLAVRNARFGDRKHPVVLVDDSGKGGPRVTTMVRYLNNDYQEGSIAARDLVIFTRCPPWRAKRRRVVPGSREATRDTRRAEGAKGDPKGASERGVQSYGRPVCSRNELAMLWRNAG